MANVGWYHSDGAWNVTVVDGTTLTGLYAADGSINVVVVDGTTRTGLYHACGAWNVFVNDGTFNRVIHPCGAYIVQESPYSYDCYNVYVVSGSFSSTPSYLLREDGSFLLREDGFKIVLEH